MAGRKRTKLFKKEPKRRKRDQRPVNEISVIERIPASEEKSLPEKNVTQLLWTKTETAQRSVVAAGIAILIFMRRRLRLSP